MLTAHCGRRRGGREVATEVAPTFRPRRMKAPTVAFDDEPSVDQEVDAANAVDLHLHVNVRSELSEHESYERLGSRFGARIGQREEDAEARRKGCEQLLEGIACQQAEVQQTVEGRDRMARLRAPQHIPHGVEQGDDAARRTALPRVRPVEAQPRSRQASPLAETARVRADAHMESRVVEDEHRQRDQQTHTGEAPTQAHRAVEARRPEIRCPIAEHIPITSQADQLASLQCRRQAPTGVPQRGELGACEHAFVGTEGR